MANRVVWTFIGRDKFSAMAKKVKASTKAATTQFKKLHEVTKKVSKGLKSAGAAMGKFSAAAALAIAGSLKAFGDMEQGVTNVLTLLNDKEVEKFGGSINKLATESLTKFGFTTEETTQALFNNVSALGANEASFVAFDAAQHLAIGGVTSLDTAVSGIAAVMNAYKLETKDAGLVANAFFAAQQKGTTDVTALATNIGQVAPIAKTMGVGFQELLATMAQLTQGGLSTEEATTSLKGALTLLKNPSTEAKKIFTELEIPFGLTAVKAATLNYTLGKLAEGMKKHENRLAAAIPNIRAFTAIATLQGDELARIREIQASMQTDQLTPAFEKQMKTLNRSTSILKGNLVAVAIEIGQQFAPAFIFIAAKIKAAANVFRGFSDKTKKWIAIGIAVVAVLAPLLLGLAAIVTVVGPGLAILGGFAAALAIWPVALGLAIAAVVAFISHAIWSKWDKIKDAFGSVKSFFGFGDDDNVEVSGAADITSKSTTDINMTVNAPKGTIGNIKTKTTGNIPGNIAVNMQEQF